MTNDQRTAHDAALLCLREVIAAGNADLEAAHTLADDVLCTLLRALGCGDVVDEFEKIEKWYA